MIEAVPMPTDVENARELLERARAWDDEPLTPEAAHNLEAVVSKAISMSVGLQGTWTSCTSDGTVWEMGAYLSRIRAFENLAVTMVDVLTRAEEVLARPSGKHADWAAPIAAEVRTHLDAARELAAKAQALSQWLNHDSLPFNEEMIARSRESLNRNEGETIDEVIARVESGGCGVME